MKQYSMEQLLIKFILFSLTLYIVAIIVFKQNYNTYTYYVNGLFIIGFAFYILLKREIKFKINIIIYTYAVFIIIALASSLYAIEFYDTAFKSLQLFLLLINMFFIYNIIKKFKADYVFMNGILLGSLVNYIFILDIVTAPFEIIMPGGGNRMMGTSGNPNVLALIMLISILVSIIYLRRKINKFFYYYQYVNILLAIYTIMLTVSKKGMIFGFILMVVFIFTQMKEPKQFIKLVGIVTMTIVIVVQYVEIDFMPIIDNILYRFSAFDSQMSSTNSSGSTAERKYLITTGLSLFQNYPLFGYGLGNFSFLNNLGVYAHNNYIELLIGVGFIGTLIFYLMYYFVYKKIIKMKDTNLKIILFMFLFIFLFMDMAVVSYGSRFIIYTLLFIFIIAENNQTIYREKTND